MFDTFFLLYAAYSCCINYSQTEPSNYGLYYLSTIVQLVLEWFINTNIVQQNAGVQKQHTTHTT